MILACPACGAANRVDDERLARGETPVCGSCRARLASWPESGSDRPEDPAAPPAAPAPARNFFARHWRGDYSLPVAYWLISFLTNIVLVASAAAVGGALDARRSFDPTAIFLGNFAILVLLGAVAIWHLVGTWRSATRYAGNPLKKGKVWGGVAKIMIVLGTLQTGFAFVKMGAGLVEVGRIAFADDPAIPDYRLTLTEGGTELKIQGGLKHGLIEDIEKILAAAPEVKTIDLESLGGRIGVGRDLFDLIARRGFDTVTNDFCASACTIAFAGGRNRWIGLNGRLGYHAGALAGYSSADLQATNAQINRMIHDKNGTSYAFLRKGDATPNVEMWFPEREELLREKAITASSSGAKSSIRLAERELSEVATQLRAKAPTRIDAVTTLTDVRVEGYRFIYVYDLEPEAHRLIQQEEHWQGQKSALQKSFCANPGLARSIGQGVIYAMQYRRKGTGEKSAYIELAGCK